MTLPRVALVVLFLANVAAAAIAWEMEKAIHAISPEPPPDDLIAATATVQTLQGDVRRLQEEAKVAAAKVAADLKTPHAQAQEERLRQFAKKFVPGALAPVFRRLARGLNLSDAQVGQLTDLVADRWAAGFMALQTARQANLDNDSIQQAISNAISGSQESIRQLLGDAGAQALTEQIALLPEEGLVQRINSGLAAGSQLNESQQLAFAQVLLANQPAAQSFPEMAVGRLLGQSGATLTPEAIAQASTILAPEQMAAVQQFQNVDTARQKVYSIMAATRQQLSADVQAGPKP